MGGSCILLDAEQCRASFITKPYDDGAWQLSLASCWSRTDEPGARQDVRGCFDLCTGTLARIWAASRTSARPALPGPRNVLRRRRDFKRSFIGIKGWPLIGPSHLGDGFDQTQTGDTQSRGKL